MRRALVLALACVATFSVRARSQETTIVVGKPAQGGSRSFSGAGATPISETTVLQFYMEARDSGGARLAYAVAIRGAPEWYQRHTTWDTVDSVPGYDATLWKVGDLQYIIAYSAAEHRLRTFGTEFDLRSGNVVLVALDPSNPADKSVTTQSHVDLVMLEPGAAAPALLMAGPDIAAFAGRSPR